MAASLREREIADDLNRHTELTALREEAPEARARLCELIDFDHLPPATLAFDDIRKKLMSLVPDEASVTPENFAKAVLGDRALFISGEREQLAARSAKLTEGEIQDVLKTTYSDQILDEQNYSAEAVAWFSQRLARGLMRAAEDAEDWNRTFSQATDSEAIRLMVDSVPNGVGSALTSDTFARITSVLEPTATAPAWPWYNWAHKLHIKLDRYSEAETAYREAIARDPKDARTWIRLGDLLRDHFQNYTDAEAAYREAIDHDSKAVWAWIGLGDLSRDYLQNDVEAEAAYREAIARNPEYSWAWLRLGDFLCTHLQRFAEAETAYREAISHEPRDAWPWMGLGDLLCTHLQRFPEAEIAYREAITHDPKYARPWMQLGDLFSSHLERYTEAETAYREAASRKPKSALPWIALGFLYSDHLARLTAASEVWDHALRLDPTNQVVLQCRLFLRRDLMGEGAGVRPLLEELRALPNERPDATHLHEAVFAAYDSNWGLACEALGKALIIGADGFESDTRIAWLTASAVLLHLNYGGELLAFLDQRGDTPRLRPWVEGLRAHHLGDRRALKNVAPEIRGTAEIFYDGIESHLKKLPEKTHRRPQEKPKRTRKMRR